MKIGLFVLAISGILLVGMPIANANSIMFFPLEDAYVYRLSPDTNYGDSNYLKVYNGDYYSYLKFDLSAIPDGSTIDPATIRVTVPFQVYSIDDPYAKLIDVYYVSNDSWGETTVTWNNKPSSNTDKICSKSTSFMPAYTVFNILLSPSIPPDGYEVWNYNADLGDNRFSIVLKTRSYGTYYMYSSENNSYRPGLTLDYTPPGGGVVPEPAMMLTFSLGLAGMIYACSASEKCRATKYP